MCGFSCISSQQYMSNKQSSGSYFLKKWDPIINLNVRLPALGFCQL